MELGGGLRVTLSCSPFLQSPHRRIAPTEGGSLDMAILSYQLTYYNIIEAGNLPNLLIILMMHDLAGYAANYNQDNGTKFNIQVSVRVNCH